MNGLSYQRIFQEHPNICNITIRRTQKYINLYVVIEESKIPFRVS